MLIPAETPRAQGDIGKANCAGRGCPERKECRRFQVRIDASWESTTGRWASFDLERSETGTCEAFKRWHPGLAS